MLAGATSFTPGEPIPANALDRIGEMRHVDETGKPARNYPGREGGLSIRQRLTLVLRAYPRKSMTVPEIAKLSGLDKTVAGANLSHLTKTTPSSPIPLAIKDASAGRYGYRYRLSPDAPQSEEFRRLVEIVSDQQLTELTAEAEATGRPIAQVIAAPVPPRRVDLVLEALNGKTLTTDEIAAKLGHDRKKVYQALLNLVSSGRVENCGLEGWRNLGDKPVPREGKAPLRLRGGGGAPDVLETTVVRRLETGTLLVKAGGRFYKMDPIEVEMTFTTRDGEVLGNAPYMP